ncbi:hypothetical protein ACMFMG_001961 [Clarireedia jacksonii]
MEKIVENCMHWQLPLMAKPTESSLTLSVSYYIQLKVQKIQHIDWHSRTASEVHRSEPNGKYAALKNTEALHVPGIRAGVGFGMNVVSPGAQALPKFLQRAGYRNPDNIHDCPWYPEYNKDLNVMEYLFSDKTVHEEFNG